MVRRRQLLLTEWLEAESRESDRGRQGELQLRGAVRQRPRAYGARSVYDGGDALAVGAAVAAQWHAGIERVSACVNPANLAFRDDLGDLDRCSCSGACVRGCCENALAGIFCDDANCAVGGKCGNRVTELTCLRLVMTRTGLGVATTLPLPPGLAVGEYCGLLRSESASTQEMRRRGYGFAFAEASADGQRVYIDASRHGSFCRFVNHSCVPNCRFEAMINRSAHKVAVVTTEAVPLGTELTLQYCQRVWFACRCVACECTRAGARARA